MTVLRLAHRYVIVKNQKSTTILLFSLKPLFRTATASRVCAEESDTSLKDWSNKSDDSGIYLVKNNVIFVEIYFETIIYIYINKKRQIHIIKHRIMMIASLQGFICVHYSNEYLVRRKQGILFFLFLDVPTVLCKNF